MEKILVVDDEKSMRDFLSIVLKKEGYAVTTAEDGETAVLRARGLHAVAVAELARDAALRR